MHLTFCIKLGLIKGLYGAYKGHATSEMSPVTRDTNFSHDASNAAEGDQKLDLGIKIHFHEANLKAKGLIQIKICSQGASVPGPGPGKCGEAGGREGSRCRGSRCRSPHRPPSAEPGAFDWQQRGALLLPQGLAEPALRCAGWGLPLPR